MALVFIFHLQNTSPLAVRINSKAKNILSERSEPKDAIIATAAPQAVRQFVHLGITLARQ